MTMVFCLPAISVGNVADWASVAVAVWAATIAALAAVIGIGGTAATVWVAHLAHRTSKRATQIAEEAARIAAQQHDDFVKTREANGQIVGRILVHEVSQLPVELHTLIERCKRIIARGAPRTEHEVDFLEIHLKGCSKSFLHGTEKSEDRLHTLPDRIFKDLAVLIGYNRSLNSMSIDLSSLITIVTYTNRAPAKEKVFKGDIRQIELLQSYLEKFSRYSLDVVNELRAYVGAEPVDLSKYDVDKSPR